MLGIYIHVPFCARKCPYCDFYSLKYSAETAELYTKAVIRNLEAFGSRGLSADTVYFGGGTPSLLTVGQVERILSACDKNFRLESPEITMECNPSSVNYGKLSAYRKAGVNRVSFGVQSANDKSLKWLGRLHNFQKAVTAVEESAKAGFDNISCDIMLGLAGQTEASLCEDIEKITALPICHVSAYMLKIEEGTAFDCKEIRETSADDEKLSSLYLTATESLEAKGFKQYEISNFALNGMESRHNNKYWSCEEYIGIGPASHSYFGGKRYCCPKNLDDFIFREVQQKLVTEEYPDKGEEYVMLGLRLKKGISFERLAMLYGEKATVEMRKLCETWEKHGLCNISGDNLSLTPKGFLLSNEIITQLIEIV